MDNDLIIPTENNKTEVLNQIDALHEEHRLKVLRELAIEYNNGLSEDSSCHIDLDKYGTSTFDLIISLWMRGIKVPPGLGFNDAYNETFLEYVHYILPMDYLVENARIVILLNNPYLVRFYLISGIELTRIGREESVNECIQQLRKKDGSQWGNVCHRDQLRAFLLNEELTNLDLAFLAIKFESKNVYYENFTLDDIYYFIRGSKI